jgi:hypothetical protein
MAFLFILAVPDVLYNVLDSGILTGTPESIVKSGQYHFFGEENT